jgi:hypothetical protein
LAISAVEINLYPALDQAPGRSHLRGPGTNRLDGPTHPEIPVQPI